ncbi:MAG: N-acetyltransferase [Caulobacteraceae bacterium]|nr:N-acetyltransferase [Caulobacteraceae bacterium]
MVILNQAMRETTASWNEREVDLEERFAWLAEKRIRGYPVLVARRDGSVLGYATFGPFRSFDGYRRTVENSVYVRPELHRQGVGRRLLEALIARARAQRLHRMVAGIEAGNAASIALHASLGFTETGRLPEVGAKFGRWLDLVLMQLALDEAERPPA